MKGREKRFTDGSNVTESPYVKVRATRSLMVEDDKCYCDDIQSSTVHTTMMKMVMTAVLKPVLLPQWVSELTAHRPASPKS
jgi:hypothetical protein